MINITFIDKLFPIKYEITRLAPKPSTIIQKNITWIRLWKLLIELYNAVTFWSNQKLEIINYNDQIYVIKKITPNHDFVKCNTHKQTNKKSASQKKIEKLVKKRYQLMKSLKDATNQQTNIFEEIKTITKQMKELKKEL